MGNGTIKGLSVNAKTLIAILLFVNIGFTVKMISKYYTMKETGYFREMTFRDQLNKRVMKAFGSAEEMNKVIADITRQKEDAEKVAAMHREQGELMRVMNKKLEESKAEVEADKAKLQKKIWELEDSLSQSKKQLGDKDATIQELMNSLEKLEMENAALRKQR